MLKIRKTKEEKQALKDLTSQKNAAKESGKTQSQKLKQLEKEDEGKAKSLKRARKGDPAHTAQETIRYKKMYEDGVCLVEDGIYSKTIKFSDINYQIAKSSIQKDIFEKWCEFYNTQNSDVNLQVLLVNKRIDQDSFKKSMLLPPKEGYEKYIKEYNMIIAEKQLQGNNSLVKEKYLSFSIMADSLADAIPRLSSIEADIVDRFKSLGSRTKVLNGFERLSIINAINRPTEPLVMDYSDLFYSGLTTKDFVAPSSFAFDNRAFYQFGGLYGQVLILRDLPLRLTDDVLKKITDLQQNLAVSIHITPIEHDKAITMVRQKIAFMEQQRFDELKRARQKGYDEELLPEELSVKTFDAHQLYEDLRDNDQNLFFTTILIQTNGESLDELTGNIYKIISTCKGVKSCRVEMLDYQQEAGLNSIYPLAFNRLEIGRNLTTSAVAVFMPFTTQELYDVGGIYYGQNVLSKNMVFFNRKGLDAPNGWILGMPGSGKSFAGKREVSSVLMHTDDDVIVIDPEREYSRMAQGFHGEVVHIAQGSHTHINPFDIDVYYSDDDNPLQLKADFIYSFIEIMTSSINSKRKSIIDRTLRLTYQPYIAKQGNCELPTLKDFYETLKKQPDEEAQSLALEMEVYVTGSLNVFAHKTNVDTSNRFIVFDICDLGKHLKSLGMLVVLDQVWNRIVRNRQAGRRTWLYIDEIQLLFENEYSTNYFDELWSRARKWGAIPTGITQNVNRLLRNDRARMMLSNSEFIMMMKQSGGDRDDLQELLGLSNEQIKYVSGSVETGSGMLYAGGATIPFTDKFNPDTELYMLMTTKPGEASEQVS